jgi:hypothetical protein
MAHQPTRPWSHAECRHRAPRPMPAVAEVAPRRRDVLTPALRAPRPRERHAPPPPQRRIRRRPRLLTRPVLVAIRVRLGWRRGPAIAAGQQVVAGEGRLGVAPRPVRAPASPNRLDVRPAAVGGPLWAEGCARRHAQAPPALPHPSGEPGRPPVARLALVDGASLDARRHKPQVLRERTGLGLGGQLRGLVEACSHRPLGPWSPDDAAAHAQRGAAARLAALPVGGLRVFARGCGRVLWCDDCPAAARGLVTRRREQTAERPVPERRRSPHDRDERSQVGPDRAHPGPPPLRRGAVRWPRVWSRSLPTGLEPQGLSARQVCER